MQHLNQKSLFLRTVIGKVIHNLRISKTTLTCNKAEEEYEIGSGVLNRIENAKTDGKILTLWKIAEAFDMKLSDIIKIVENEVGEDFHLTDL